MIKRLLIVLAVLGAFFVVSPTEPASAQTSLSPCGGANYFTDPNFVPAGRVWIPTVFHGTNYPPGYQCVMRVGLPGMYDNWGVYFLQRTLRQCYGQNIALDLDFGPATREALRNAQRWEGIPDDGQYGPQTRRTIKWVTDPHNGGAQKCVRFTWA